MSAIGALSSASNLGWNPPIPETPIIPFHDPNSIKNFSKFGVWDHRVLLLKILVVIPIIITLGIFLYRVYKDPESMKVAAAKLKDFFVTTFCKGADETPEAYGSRLGATICGTLFVATLVAGAAAAAFILLPEMLAISSLLCLIFVVVKGYQNRGAIKAKFASAILWTKTAFVAQKDETPSERKKRILKNTAIISGIVFGVLAIIAIGFYIHHLVAIASSVYGIVDHLPLQIPLVVVLEYLAIATAHFYKAYKAAKNGKKGEAIFHIIAGILAIAFPIVNVCCFPTEFRLHHVVIGLLFMLVPAPGLQFLGSMMAADSFLYGASPSRGFYEILRTKGPHPKLYLHLHSYDLMNLIVNNFALIFLVYTIATLFHWTINHWLEERAKKKAIEAKELQNKNALQEIEMTDLSKTKSPKPKEESV